MRLKSDYFKKGLYFILFILFGFLTLVVLSGVVILIIMYAPMEEEDRFSFGINFKIENKKDQEVTLIFFPINLSDNKAFKKDKVEQIKIEAKSEEYFKYYLGKKVNFETLMIGAIAWGIPPEANFAAFEEKPCFVRTFYKPKFEIGPEKYNTFAKIIIE